MGVEVHERYINPYTDFGFNRLFEQAEIARFTPEERREYQESIKDYWDYYSTMKTAEDKGHAAGLEEGHAAGLEEGIERVARAMKASGVSVAEIIKFTGLTEEQVAQL